MTDVFISYKREQRSQCARIAEQLRSLSLDVWFDAKLESGTRFDAEIEEKIHLAKAVLVLWSPEAAKSAWVRNEATIGQDRNVLVSVEIAPCKRPVQFTTTQTESLLDPEFSDADPSWRRILTRIGRLVGRADLAAYADLEAPPPKLRRRIGSGWLIAASALVAAIGFGVFAVWREQGAQPATPQSSPASPPSLAAAPGDPCQQARADWNALAASSDVALITAFRDEAPQACSVQRGLAQSRLDSLASTSAAAERERTAAASVDRAFAGAWVGAEGRAGPCGALPWRFERTSAGFRRVDAGGDGEPFELASADPPTLRYAETGMRIVAQGGELAVIPADNSQRCFLRRQ